MKFCFEDIVVVNGSLIGVVVKDWLRFSPNQETMYEVYVRMHSKIECFKESEIQRYMVRPEFLDGMELEYQKDAMKDDEAFATIINRVRSAHKERG